MSKIPSSYQLKGGLGGFWTGEKQKQMNQIPTIVFLGWLSFLKVWQNNKKHTIT